MLVGCGLMTEDLLAAQREVLTLPVIELEDCLIPPRADTLHEQIPVLQTLLADYHGEVLVSGPFIDLNPGTSERLILRATRQRFEEAHGFASAIGATEIVFLSSFIPIIYLSLYEDSWVSQSITFWRSYLDAVEPGIQITLGNTFEFTPTPLIRVVEAVDRPNFKLAFDVGLFWSIPRSSSQLGWRK
jgi:sugar phosphate isomerase/epimerase